LEGEGWSKRQFSASTPPEQAPVALAGAIWRVAGKHSLEAIRVIATSAIPHWEPSRGSTQARAAAPRGERPVWWERDAGIPTPVFDRDRLQAGDVIAGPAIVEGADTVYAVRPGWRLTVEPHGFFIMTRG
jgi:N-methylhydantoinase A/oxoprolinase/acetone carboxylase beta subunit